jgi:hypothetical protein
MNRLMSDIIEQKQLNHEEHQALKHIGKVIHNCGYEMVVRNFASRNIVNEEYENSSEMEKLGSQFLAMIDRCNESANEQKIAHALLIILHKIALDIL